MASQTSWTSKRVRVTATLRDWPPQTAFTTVQLRNLYVALWLHTDRDPSAEEWSAGCSAFRELRRRSGDNTAALRALIVSDGGGPNAIQRAQFFRPAVGGMHRASAISISLSNPVKRGIVTAISWVNPRFCAFTPDQWQPALAHIGLADHEALIWRELLALQRQLPPNRTLAEIAGNLTLTSASTTAATGAFPQEARASARAPTPRMTP